jgi:hypothetical protein
MKRKLLDEEVYTVEEDGQILTLGELITGSEYFEYIDGNPLNCTRANLRVMSKQAWELKYKNENN